MDAGQSRVPDSPMDSSGRPPRDVAGLLWSRFLHACVVNAPLIAFLLVYRLYVDNKYASYTLPVLGEFPKGFLLDLSVVLLVLLIWSVASLWHWLRALLLLALVPCVAFVVLFRQTDHYYYSATQTPLNAFVLYGNLSSANEGAAIVFNAPFFALLGLAVVVHYVVYTSWRRYRLFLERVTVALLSRPGRLIVLPAFAAVMLLLAINAHALRRQPRRIDVLRASWGEYMFVIGVPRFLREEALKTYVLARRPNQSYLPAADIAPSARSVVQARPNVFLITVESFNALYTLPPAQLHPSLTEEVMPFFKSLERDGYMFSRVYTSSAYTFNGIVAVLCSQFTMSESVWGKDCLPELLARNGYEPFSFVSIPQLRPYRYDNFRAMGLARSRVFDAMRMRQGKRNVFFSPMTDQELLGYAAGVADSVTHASKKPIFIHVSTDAMHVPGLSHPGCTPYAFPATENVDALTRRMINSAHCTDHDLAGFIAHLKRSGLYDDALIIVLADHAFNLSFWDHKESELARIPLFVKLPKSDTSVRTIDTDRLAAQVDVAPTIIDYLGLHSDRPMYGRSLLESSVPAPQSVAGISSSRLLSLATRSGVVLHVHGKSDVQDTNAASELDALFDTVLYFDQNPTAFEPAVRNPDQAARWKAVVRHSALTTSAQMQRPRR
jgi:phosphoglycerol transferase MdoB-like AlkP superfamily enzyme